MDPNGILIYGELNNNGISPIVFELLSKSVELKQKIWNQRIMVCLIGPRIKYDDIIYTLGEYGANEVVIVSDDKLKDYNISYYGEIFTKIAKKYPPRIILIGATNQGKEIASYCATKLETGLTADCTNLDISDDYLLLSTRPTFGGQLTADILCKTFPQMATVQQNTFVAVKSENTVNAIYNWIDTDKIDNKIILINEQKKENNIKDVTEAEIIVAGGKGACTEEGFKLINELANKLNAAVAGTREAFEKGYISKAQQIGQTGKTVAPKLYVAVGISGALQHIAGIKNSNKIIAINSDKNAPIFNCADIGYVGDLYKILPELIENINK